jgi:hypothetical protein
MARATKSTLRLPFLSDRKLDSHFCFSFTRRIGRLAPPSSQGPPLDLPTRRRPTVPPKLARDSNPVTPFYDANLRS